MRTPLAEGPTHFPQCTLETGGPGSPSRSVPFEKLPSACHAKQQNQHRHTAGMRYVEHMPSQLSPPHKHTLFKSYFFSFTAVTQFLCLLLCLAARSRSLSCLCPFCMCELRSQLPRARGQPNSFFLYLFPNPITQPGQDCPSLNGKGILREIVAGNNKPTCHEDKSIFKALRFSRTTAQKSITSCIFWVALLYYTPKVLPLIVLVLLLKAQALIDCNAATQTGPFQSWFMKLWIGP